MYGELPHNFYLGYACITSRTLRLDTDSKCKRPLNYTKMD
jgi:hypothetical protein